MLLRACVPIRGGVEAADSWSLHSISITLRSAQGVQQEIEKDEIVLWNCRDTGTVRSSSERRRMVTGIFLRGMIDRTLKAIRYKLSQADALYQASVFEDACQSE